MPPELAGHVPPGLAVVLAAATAIGVALASLTRILKDVPFIGRISRTWEEKQQQEAKRIVTTQAMVDEAADELIELEVKPLRKRIADLEDQLAVDEARNREQTRLLKRELQLYADWSSHLTRWWFEKAQALAADGVVLPPPPHPTFTEFRRDWERTHPA